MYGSEETDLVVKYYDLAFGISGESEVGWYLDKVKTFGGPVLDLACGTGRLAIIIAKEGFEVTAIDSSKGMLHVFEQNLLKSSSSVQDRIRIDRQNMTGFNLDRKFNTIICCDAFFHNLTLEEEILCLDKIAAHLAPRGVFVFNLPNPSCEFIVKASKNKMENFEERGCFDIDDKQGSLLVEQANIGNPSLQTITTKLRIKRFDQNGDLIEEGESGWTTRYLFQYEAVHLLYRCGFEIKKLVGDYKDGPVKQGSQLVFEAKLRKQGKEKII
ncbi:MAG: class I SAM-dependent methyltransferase [Brevefilum sp.]|nr:class I SAM-dependent methyltransferase [Brevefilum sp.]MDT8381612.1 class I SAM-dependent methyltransferase [Brevefilum sp.]MDW7753846.1 class I SAM-dependent methyltransferase [Brevefilum sp.]